MLQSIHSRSLKQASPIESEIPHLHKAAPYANVFRPAEPKPDVRKRTIVRKQVPYGTYSQKGERMPRHSYCRQTKLSDIGGRIDYITNPDRQEHLYATYDTATPEFWKQLKEENHKEYDRYGCSGMVVEGREWIIALEESLTKEDPEMILKIFTDTFRDKYGVDCLAALHHNKTESNYHIHLIYSERQRLDKPIEKIATRNMFLDEKGHHKRTKKEILNSDGSIRQGCKIISKGKVYETAYLSGKNPLFKSKKYAHEVKVLFTDLNNSFIEEESKKLSVFQQGSVYLATKKIGKNNPKETFIRVDNAARKDWNLKADEALVCGVPEESIMQIKKEYIKEPVKQSILLKGKKPGLLKEIIHKAISRLSEAISSIHRPIEPVLTVDLEEFKEMKVIKKELDANQKQIDGLKIKLGDIQNEFATLYAPWKKTNNLKEQAETMNQIQDLQREHGKIVTSKGYQNVQSFMRAYNQSMVAIMQYQDEMKEYRKQNGKEEPETEKKQSIHDKLNQYKEQAKSSAKSKNERIFIR